MQNNFANPFAAKRGNLFLKLFFKETPFNNLHLNILVKWVAKFVEFVFKKKFLCKKKKKLYETKICGSIFIKF